VAENLKARALFQDALSGRLDRRQLLQRAAALGLSAPVAMALAQASIRPAMPAGGCSSRRAIRGSSSSS